MIRFSKHRWFSKFRFPLFPTHLHTRVMFTPSTYMNFFTKSWQIFSIPFPSPRTWGHKGLEWQASCSIWAPRQRDTPIGLIQALPGGLPKSKEEWNKLRFGCYFGRQISQPLWVPLSIYKTGKRCFLKIAVMISTIIQNLRALGTKQAL